MNRLFSRFSLGAFVFLAILTPAVRAQWRPRNPVTAIQRQSDGVLLTQKEGSLKIQVCSDSIIHVVYSPAATSQRATR